MNASETNVNPLIVILVAVFGGASLPGALIVYLLIFPDKFEKLVAVVSKGCWRLKLFGVSARKTYLKYDLQSSVNAFVRRTAKDVPGLYARGIRVEWEKPGEIDRDSFLKGEDVIVRLSHKRSEAENLATAVYLFVATSLLHRAKRYISPSQGKATDLFVTSKLLEQQKPDVVDYFLEQYLHPGLVDKKGKPQELYEKFEQIDRTGLFFPLYLREVDHLGQKVFGKPLKDQIIIEINDLIDYLIRFSRRAVGEEIELDFQKNYCKFGIMIVGKVSVVSRSLKPYINYISNHVKPSNIETLYMIGHLHNVEAIRRIAAEVHESFEEIASLKYRGQIRVDGEIKSVPQYLLVLRAKNRPLVTRVS